MKHGGIKTYILEREKTHKHNIYVMLISINISLNYDFILVF